MQVPRTISVLMPTWQGEEFLERVLAALAVQRINRSWEFLAIDSGSTDRTLAILRGWQGRFPVPLRIESIHQIEFDHGDTRNLLAARSSGDLLVFLTQDAIPSSPHWLATLVQNFEDPAVGAATCRNLPRPDAELLTRVFSAQDPGYQAGRREVRLPDAATYAQMDAHQRRVLYNFNDVASALRRELWERHPFPRTEFGEDLLMARALLEAGWTVVYDDRATIEHSHDYNPAQMRARARIDAQFNAEWLDRICVGSSEDAAILTERQLARDRVELERTGLQGAEFERELARARELREAVFFGLYEGGATTRRFPKTRVRAGSQLTLLFVVHAFPPDTWAGTEVYTLALAEELAFRGHRVSILTRVGAKASEAEGGPREFSVEEGQFQGLRVFRLVHRLEHENLRQSYDEPRVLGPYREVLARTRPDLVHFQHLIHLSTGMVAATRELGIPTVLHCHDYWSVCPRVQLIRPDGVRCEKNQGGGCFNCIHERHVGSIPRWKRLFERRPELALELTRGERKGRPWSAREHDQWEGFHDFWTRQDVVMDAYRAADLCISPSRFLRQKLVDAGLDARATIYSDNGLRLDRVQALSKAPDPQGRLRVGFVGSLVWYKGVATLVRAMARLAGERCVLNVFGDFKPDQDEHHRELERLAQGAPVVFRGRFENRKLAEVYREIDVLVVPSVWFENSPITIHEAWLFATPVVTSGIGGMAEFVRDGVDGLHFQVGDDQDLARTLTRFLREPDLMAQLSRDFPRCKSIEDNALELEFRYRALVARERAPGERLLFERKGRDATAQSADALRQGADMLLVRSERGFLEYDVQAAGPGRRRFSVDVFALGGESLVELSARVLVDGRELGRIPPFRAGPQDELKRFSFAADLDQAPRTLRLEPLAEHAWLRVQRLAVHEPAPDDLPPARPGTR